MVFATGDIVSDNWLTLWKRGAELDAFTAVQLRDMLTAAGYEVRGRKNKLAYKNALMHLDGLPVQACIVESLGLVKLDGVT